MPKNRLIISFWDTTPSKHKIYNESMRCTSEAGADKIIARRPDKSMSHARYFDNTGQEIVYNFNHLDPQ